jgi:hypothetical protein
MSRGVGIGGGATSSSASTHRSSSAAMGTSSIGEPSTSDATSGSPGGGTAGSKLTGGSATSGVGSADGSSTSTMLPHLGQIWISPMAESSRTLSRCWHVVQVMVNASTFSRPKAPSRLRRSLAVKSKYYYCRMLERELATEDQRFACGRISASHWTHLRPVKAEFMGSCVTGSAGLCISLSTYLTCDARPSYS